MRRLAKVPEGMIFNIEHTTEYSYPESVVLDPHLLRLTPRPGPNQRVLSQQVEIFPEPRGTSEFLDAHNNVAVSAWFEGRTNSLKIVNRCTVETLGTNPFDFLLLRANNVVPMGLDPIERRALDFYLDRPTISVKVDQFAAKLIDQADGYIGRFLTLLTATLHADFGQMTRETGEPYTPEVCLEQRRGACRDLAVLFMDACRSVGIPARFVSGYQEGSSRMTKRYLHAWPEVYLAQAGWRGYDPTLNIAVADRHVPLAAAYSPKGAAPVTGTYWSSRTDAVLAYDLKLAVS